MRLLSLFLGKTTGGLQRETLYSRPSSLVTTLKRWLIGNSRQGVVPRKSKHSRLMPIIYLPNGKSVETMLSKNQETRWKNSEPVFINTLLVEYKKCRRYRHSPHARDISDGCVGDATPVQQWWLSAALWHRPSLNHNFSETKITWKTTRLLRGIINTEWAKLDKQRAMVSADVNGMLLLFFE